MKTAARHGRLTNPAMIFEMFLFILLANLAAWDTLNNTITIETVSQANYATERYSNEKLSILKSPHVHMKNESAVFEKINGIVAQGADKLQFITDFDQTITKQYENAVSTLDSVGIFFQSKQLPKSIMKNIYSVFSKFSAIKFDSTIEIERKKQLSTELAETTHRQLKGLEFDRREIERISRKYGPAFRNRTSELFSKLNDLHIPAVIFSAGLSDIIEEQLRQKNVQYNNIHVIANHLKFNGTKLEGFENYEKPIDIFNKHEHLSQYLNSLGLESRRNIILMGDHIGDATIVRGLKNVGIILKIGFFYNQTEESLKIYKEKFDIVLEDDQTMDVILDIIDLL